MEVQALRQEAKEKAATIDRSGLLLKLTGDIELGQE